MTDFTCPSPILGTERRRGDGGSSSSDLGQ